MHGHDRDTAGVLARDLEPPVSPPAGTAARLRAPTVVALAASTDSPSLKESAVSSDPQPARAPLLGGQGELERLVVRVEEHAGSESSTTRSPRSSGLGIVSPFRNMPTALPNPDDQSSPSSPTRRAGTTRCRGAVRAERRAVEEVAPPEHRDARAGTDQPPREREQRAVLRAPSRTRRSRCPGSRRCCCRTACGRSRRRRAASGCPARGSSVARKFRCWRVAEGDAPPGSSVGPSTPQFQDRLWLSPSAVVLAVGLVVLLVVGDQVVAA